MSKKLSCVSVLILALTCLAETVSADEVMVSSGEQSIEVRYDAADIRSGPGARDFLERLETAAALVCGPAPDAANAEADASYKLCTLIAVDSAVAQAGGPLFTDESEANASLGIIVQ